jgi:diaminopimelate decarboxylase
MDEATLATVVEHKVPVNAGSIDMLHQLAAVSKGHHVWLRINPGFGHGHSNKTNTGGEHSKHGIWHSELEAALDAIKAGGLVLAGLHMHIGSGVDYGHLQEVCGAMVKLVERTKAAGVDLHAISAGGGLSIPTVLAMPPSTPTTTTACGMRRASRPKASWATAWDWSSNPAASWWPSPACCWAPCAPPRMRAATTSCWSTPASTS